MRRYPSNGYIGSAAGLFIGVAGPAFGRLLDGQPVGKYTLLVYTIALLLCLTLAVVGIRKARAAQES